MYLVTRKDLTQEQQVIQLMHAAVEHAYNNRLANEHPSFVVLSVKDKTELQQLQDKIKAAGITTTEFQEPYNDWGLTAVSCTVTQEQRFLFKHLQLWSLKKPTALEKS